MAASQAASSLAALAASEGTLDEAAYMEASFPQISDVSHVSISVSTAKREPYAHHLSYGNGRFKDRVSCLTFREVEATVEVRREFTTPLGALFFSFLNTEGYRIVERSVALKDETVSSGNW